MRTLLTAGLLSRCSFCSSSLPSRVLLLTKITRYELEKTKGSYESQFISSLKDHHERHTSYVRDLYRALKDLRIPHVKTASRLNLSSELVDWADMILTAGGDGTFLMGASKVTNDSKPVIGFNTDPSKSEGYLLLPSHLGPREALERILTASSEKKWYYRSRLRITLVGPEDKISAPPLEIHQQKVMYPEYRFIEESAKEGGANESPSQETRELILPVLALNEVFIGESLSSRVSSLKLQIDDSPPVSSKNSGFCVSTGSGSTSWTFNINKLTHQAVTKILEISESLSGCSTIKSSEDPSFIQAVTSRFNNELLFRPDDCRMSYTIRDALSPGTFPSQVNDSLPLRGFAHRSISVRSLCLDACLVIDGSLSYRFNDGISARMEIRKEDALKTVVLAAD